MNKITRLEAITGILAGGAAVLILNRTSSAQKAVNELGKKQNGARISIGEKRRRNRTRYSQ